MSAAAPDSRFSAAALTEMIEALGPGGALTDPADVAPYVVDFRALYHGRTPLVARPDSVARVQSLVAIAARHRIGIVPQGGNTSYCGGATPDEHGGQIVLSLARLNRVRSVDAAGYSMVVDAGCTLARVQQAAADADRLFPLSLGSEGTCQIGGNLATNAGGTAVLRYGMIRDLVLGLEVILADGRRLDQLKCLRKDNTGYDVKQLFLGAEGTLGVITGACLKLFPLPAAQLTAFVAVDGMAAAVALLSRVRAQFGDAVTAFEYVPYAAYEMAQRRLPGVARPIADPYPGYVLLELGLARAAEAEGEALERFLSEALARDELKDAVLARSARERDALWYLRSHIPEAQKREGASLKHDISLPIAGLAAFVREAESALAQLAPVGRLVAYGHLGDGNLHFNLSPAPGASDAELLALTEPVKRLVHDLVAAHGGSFSAEHGVGQLKVAELARYEDPVALELMRTVKRALDPQGIMNPGKVIAP